MEQPADPHAKAQTTHRSAAQRRDDRLAAALKANIARRKAQAGSRAGGAGEGDEDGNDNNETA